MARVTTKNPFCAALSLFSEELQHAKRTRRSATGRRMLQTVPPARISELAQFSDFWYFIMASFSSDQLILFSLHANE
jgi:hypothetical protein